MQPVTGMRPVTREVPDGDEKARKEVREEVHKGPIVRTQDAAKADCGDDQDPCVQWVRGDELAARE
jgi:hypothetical protein